MAYYWGNPVRGQSVRLPYGNFYMGWGPEGFTVPRGGPNLAQAPAPPYQPHAQPPAQGIPVGPAHAVMPNTGLAPAGLPAQQTGSLAPADPTTYRNFNAATPAAPGPQPDHGADRARGVAAAPYVAYAAGVAPEHPANAVTPAPTRGAPSSQPSRAAPATPDVAPPAANAAPIHQANVAVGGARALPLPAGPPHGPVEHEDAADLVDDETVVDEDDTDTATMLGDDEEFWTEDDDGEDSWTDDDDDEEFWTDDDEDDEQPVRYVEPVLRPVFSWD